MLRLHWQVFLSRARPPSYLAEFGGCVTKFNPARAVITRRRLIHARPPVMSRGPRQSYATHPHANGRSSSDASYVMLRMGSSQPQKSALSPSTSA